MIFPKKFIQIEDYENCWFGCDVEYKAEKNALLGWSIYTSQRYKDGHCWTYDTQDGWWKTKTKSGMSTYEKKPSWPVYKPRIVNNV